MINFPGSDPFSNVQSSGVSGTQPQSQALTDIAALQYLSTLQPTQQTQQSTTNILGQLDQLVAQNSQTSNSPMNESQQANSLAAWMQSQNQGLNGNQFQNQGPNGNQFQNGMDPASFSNGFAAGSHDMLSMMQQQDQLNNAGSPPNPGTTPPPGSPPDLGSLFGPTNPINGPASSTTSTNGDQTTTTTSMQNGDSVGLNNGDAWSNMDSGGAALHGHSDGSIQLSSTKGNGSWGNATWSDKPSWMKNGGGSPPSAQQVTDEVTKIQQHSKLDEQTIRQFLAQQYMNSNWNGSLDQGTIGTNIAPAFGVDPTALYKTYKGQGGEN